MESHRAVLPIRIPGRQPRELMATPANSEVCQYVDELAVYNHIHLIRPNYQAQMYLLSVRTNEGYYRACLAYMIARGYPIRQGLQERPNYIQLRPTDHRRIGRVAVNIILQDGLTGRSSPAANSWEIDSPASAVALDYYIDENGRPRPKSLPTVTEARRRLASLWPDKVEE